MDRDPVEAQLRHLQEASERERVELSRAIGTDAGTVARETVCKGAILGEGGLTADDGHRLDVEAVGLQAAVDRGVGRGRETFGEGDVALSRVVVDLGEEERAGVVPQGVDAVGHLVDPGTDLRDEGGGHASGLLPLHMDGGAGGGVGLLLSAE